MTVETTLNVKRYESNGLTATFAFPFLILDASHMEVTLDGVTTAAFTIDPSDVGDPNGGDVVLSTIPASGVIVTLRRVVPYTQLIDYITGDPFPAETHERALDLGAMMAMQLSELIDRCVKFPVTSGTIPPDVPDPDLATNQGKFLKLTASGWTFETVQSSDIAVPLTAKGQLLVHDGSTHTAFGPGSDGQLLVYDSAQAKGVKTLSVLSVLGTPLTTRGQILRRGSSAVEAYAKGTEGQYLGGDGADTLWRQLPWPQGQCQLALGGGNLVLSPYNGNIVVLKINGVWQHQSLADSGVSLSPSALSVDTTYYIYLYDNSGVHTLEASATVPARDADTGFQIKTGDASRLLVGLARTVTGPAWVDSATQRYVRSWFNDVGVSCLGEFSVDRSTASAPYAEVNSEVAVNFLTWGSEILTVQFGGTWSSSADALCGVKAAIDGSGFDRGVVYRRLNGAITGLADYHSTHYYDQAAAGKHTLTLMAKTNTGTLTFEGGAGGDGTTGLRAFIQGVAR